jgi:hypothetical protein
MGLAVKDGERIALSPAGRACLDRENHAHLGSVDAPPGSADYELWPLTKRT